MEAVKRRVQGDFHMTTDHKILAASIGAALLVGGGAVAAFNEMRASGNKVEPVVAQSALTSQPTNDLAMAAAPLTPSAATLAQTRAPILAVNEVKQGGTVSARVLEVEPVTKTVAQNTPRQSCYDQVVQERLPERDGNIGGTVIGAVIGGLAGNQVGDGRGRDAATVAGAAAGGYIGNRIDRRHVGGRVVNRTEQRCQTVNDRTTSEKTIAYNVTYRTPEGETGVKRVTKKPGTRIDVAGATKSAYDVTYSFAGRERTVRLDDRPSGNAFPVVDGRVVTSL